MSRIDHCYEILGLHPGASPQEIKQAYRDLAKVWHPDRFAHDARLQAKAQSQFREIHLAYEALHSQPCHYNDPAFNSNSHVHTTTQMRTPTPSTSPNVNAGRSQPLGYHLFIFTAKLIALIFAVILARSLLDLCVGM